MNENISKYLDEIFSSYEDVRTVRELKEEMLQDLQDKLEEKRRF